MKELKQLPPDIEDKLLDVFTWLEDNRGVDHYDYTGLGSWGKSKPYLITFGGEDLMSLKFCMTEKSNGDYDGYEGLNVSYSLEEK